MAKEILLTPGPAPVPEDIIKVMSEPIIHHRTPQYMEISKVVNENLKKVFKTTNNVLTFASSGTGAMEASVSNALSKGDSAIVVMGGKFGERFAEICEAYGVNVIPLNIEWGTRPDPAAVREALDKNPKAKAVFMQLCETSTATVYDVKSVGEVVSKKNAILVVDAISGLGSDNFETDNWNVDIAIGGSQKGFMLPPGLSFAAVSKKAWALIEKSNLPKYYFDFKKYENLMAKSDNPWTPAITLVIGLQKSLSVILGEGVDNFIRRHREDAEFVRNYARKLGLRIFSKFPSDAVTAVNIPKDIDTTKLMSSLKAENIRFAGGQGELKGKILRIAHMGGVTRKDLEYALKKLEEILKKEDIKV